MISLFANKMIDELFDIAIEDIDAPESEDDRVHRAWEAIHELQKRHASAGTLQKAVALCSSIVSNERRVGAGVLGQFGSHHPERPIFLEERFQTLKLLIERELAPTGDATVLVEALHAMAHTSDLRQVDIALGLIEHPLPRMRYATTHMLIAGKEDERTIAALITLSADTNALTRDWATFGLAQQMEQRDTPEMREAFIARLSDPDRETRTEAILGLALRKDLRVVQSLIDALGDDEPSSMHYKAAWVLACPGLCPALLAVGQRLPEYERELWLAAMRTCGCDANIPELMSSNLGQDTMTLEHRRMCSVSHFQIALLDAASPNAYPEIFPGGELVIFGRNGIVVSTAWDDNGQSEPLAEVIVTGLGRPELEFEDLIPIATGEIEIGDKGIEVGNLISCDLQTIMVPAGRWRVLVLTDTLQVFHARTVRFHIWPLAEVEQTLAND
jgi:HEAT repeats